MAKRLRIDYKHRRKEDICLDDYPWCKPHPVLVKHINLYKIVIYSQTDYAFKGHRHSYTVSGAGKGYCASGGYGQNNEIKFPTVESALLDSLKYVTKDENELKIIRREALLEEIL